MKIESTISLIIIAIAIIYTAVMVVNFLMSLEEQSLAKQQLDLKLGS